MDHPVANARSNDGIVNSLTSTHESGRESVSSERVWSGPISAVDADQVRPGSGQEPVARQVVVHHDAVAVVALHEGDTSPQPDGVVEILVICQYRHSVCARLWEIPAGLLGMAEEESAVAATRELTEETDYEAATWFTPVEFYTSPGLTTEGIRILLAQNPGLSPEDRRTVREDEETEFVPIQVHSDEALDAVVGDRLHNPSMIFGVLATAQAYTRGWSGPRLAGALWLHSPESLQDESKYLSVASGSIFGPVSLDRIVTRIRRVYPPW